MTNISLLSKYNFSKYIRNGQKRKSVLLNKKMSEKDFEAKSFSEMKKAENEPNLLYHGSEEGINGVISVNANKGLCDFGNGFYTGTNIRQAENRVVNKGNSIVYSFKYNFTGYKVYSFSDITLWALYVGYNRKVVNIDNPKLKREFSKINSSDIVIGYIADDKISAVFTDFVEGNITDLCLAECLKLVKYGKQVVFKTKRSLNALSLYNSYSMSKSMRKNSLLWNTHVKESMEGKLAKLKIEFRGKGRYIDDIVKEYNNG